MESLKKINFTYILAVFLCYLSFTCAKYEWK